MLNRTTSLLLAATAAALAAAPAAQADTLPATCANVQTVITGAANGDTVELTGLCSVPAGISWSNKGLTLKGAAGTNGFTGGSTAPMITVTSPAGTTYTSRFENLTLTDGVGGGAGGGSAIRVTGCQDTQIVDSTFRGNRADDSNTGTSGDSGGAVRLALTCTSGSANVLVQDSTFGGAAAGQGNGTGARGGALALTSNSRLVVTGSTFTGNDAGRDGGAIHFGPPNTDATFQFGGGEIRNSTFQANVGGVLTPGGGSGSQGGALSFAGATIAGSPILVITDNVFRSNKMDDADDNSNEMEGAAIALTRANATGVQASALMARNLIVDNTVPDCCGQGAGVSVKGWRLISIRDRYIGNTLPSSSNTSAAALSLEPSTLFGNAPTSLQMYGTVFRGNFLNRSAFGSTIGLYGAGAMPSQAVTADLRHVTMIGNLGPDEPFGVGSLATLSIRNSIVYGNGPTTGEPEGFGATTIENSIVCGPGYGAPTGAGNFCADPLLTADGHQTALSPGKDLGGAAGAAFFVDAYPEIALDLDEAPRTSGAGTDIGADELSDADLSATLSTSPTGNVTVGQPLTLTFTTTNAGPDLASDVVATLPVPAGTTFTSASADQGSCSEASGTITCALGGVASGGDAVVTAVVTPTAAGAISATGSATSANPDASPATASASATAVAPSTGGPDPQPTATPGPGATPTPGPRPTATPGPRPTPTATPTPQPAELPASSVLTLPSAKACVSRRQLTLKLKQPKGSTLKTVVVKVGKAKAKTYKGATLKKRKIDLKGLPKGKVKVVITITLTDGRSVKVTKTYTTCAPKKRK